MELMIPLEEASAKVRGRTKRSFQIQLVMLFVLPDFSNNARMLALYG